MTKRCAYLLIFAMIACSLFACGHSEAQEPQELFLDGNWMINITADAVYSNITLTQNATLAVRGCGISIVQSYDYENGIVLSGNATLSLTSANLSSTKAMRITILDRARLIISADSSIAATTLEANGGSVECTLSSLHLANISGSFSTLTCNYSQIILRDDVNIDAEEVRLISSSLFADSATVRSDNITINDSSIACPIEMTCGGAELGITTFSYNATVSSAGTAYVAVDDCKFGNALFINSEVNATGTTFGMLDLHGTMATLRNCSSTASRLQASSASWYWPIEVTVADARDFPISGVEVRARQSNSSECATLTTSYEGKVTFMLLSRMQTDGSTTSYSYDIETGYFIDPSWVNSSKHVNVTAFQKELLKLAYEIVKFGASISLDSSSEQGRLGKQVSLNATVMNTGNARGTIHMTAEAPPMGDGWNVQFSEGQFVLNASEMRVITITIRIPQSLPPSYYQLLITARYDEDPAVFATEKFEVVVNQRYDLKLKLFITNHNPGLGDPVRLEATVTNAGTEHLYSISVIFYCDDVELGSETIAELARGQSVTIAWTWTPSSSGVHTLTATAEMFDATIADNSPEDNTAGVIATAAPYSTSYCYLIVVIGCVVGLFVLRWVASRAQGVLAPMLGCMIAGVLWGLISILAQIPSNPECAAPMLDGYVIWLGSFAAITITFYVVVHLVVDRKILNNDFPSTAPLLSIVLDAFILLGKFSTDAPGWLVGPLVYQSWLGLLLYFGARTSHGDSRTMPEEEGSRRRAYSSNFVHFAFLACPPLFLGLMPLIGPMGAEMIISLILGLMLGTTGFFVYSKREEATMLGTVKKIVKDSVGQRRAPQGQYPSNNGQYGEVYASPSYETQGYYESYHAEESAVPDLPPEEEMPSSFRLPTQPPAFVHIRGPQRGTPSHSHGHGHKEPQKRMVRPGVVKLQGVTREKKCIACKSTENVTHVCAAADCGQYYCNDCAHEIKQVCLDCGQPLKRIEEEVN